MGVNRGKDFESTVFKCIKNMNDVYIMRINDNMGGYSGVCGACDFVAYKRPQFYMLECKSVHGNLLSIHGTNSKKLYGNISNAQWSGLLEASQYSIVAGVLIWWIDKDVTKFVTIQELVKYRESGHKSIKYDAPIGIAIQGKKKRVFFNYDFEEFFNHFEV